MEQDESEIDNYFRKKLQDHKTDPPKFVWENIQQNLDTSKPGRDRKNKIRYTLGIAASTVLLIGIGYLVFKVPLEEKTGPVTKTGLIKDSIKTDLPVASSKTDEPETVSLPSEKKQKIAPVKRNEEIKLVNLSTTDKKAEFFLPDSSKVTLNKNTSLSYIPTFSEKRELTLTNGEAYFEVRKKQQPFIVNGNLSVIEVHGTTFMVRSFQKENKDEIYVASGKVSVAHLRTSSLATFLLPDEKCVIRKEGPQVLEKITEENYSAWKSEEIVFQNTELKTVIKTLEEYYGVRLQINNPEILSCRFTGRFEKSSFNEILQVLTATFNLSYNDREGVYTLAGKGCK